MKPMASALHVPLVEVTRGEHVESLHAGSVAVVDARGKLLYSAGDPECLTFTRSSIKPFQAAPFIAGGGDRHFALDQREIALLCASHSGEEMHVAAVRSILAKAGAPESQLGCGCHVPMRYSLDALPPAGAVFTAVHHNCSGKHAGFLAYCAQHGLSSTTYLAPAHPLQQAVRQSVARFAGMDAAALAAGTDGCSAPNYAMPLSRLALSFARLAAADTEGEYGEATGRSDVAFMQAAPGDFVAKIGAEGVQGIGVRSAGIGIAVKVADGNARALCATAVAVLQELGLVKDPAVTSLSALARPQLHNYAGTRVGEVRSVLRLQARG
jgi:L-asparaginase II